MSNYIVHLKNTFTLICSSCLLSACGGGGTTLPVEPEKPKPTENTTYQTLLAKNNETSTLAGTATGFDRRLGQGDAHESAFISGNLSHKDGSFSITTEKSDTFQANITSSTLLKNDKAQFNKTDLNTRYGVNSDSLIEFEYVHKIPEAGDTLTQSGSGFIGIPTRGLDIPVTGVATYRGGVQAQIVQAGHISSTAKITSLGRGSSTITVNFKDAKAKAIFENFQNNVNVSSPPVTKIEIDNMLVRGNTLKTGIITTYKGKAVVDIVGNNKVDRVNAQFYGINANVVQPAEVAGHFSSAGSTGLITGSFVAK